VGRIPASHFYISPETTYHDSGLLPCFHILQVHCIILMSQFCCHLLAMPLYYDVLMVFMLTVMIGECPRWYIS